MELKGNDKIYFQLYMNNSFKKNLGFDVLNLNVQNPDMTASSHTFWPPHNPNWFKMNLLNYIKIFLLLSKKHMNSRAHFDTL